MIRDSSPSILRRPISSRQWCQRVHGISESDTEDAPVFSKVWQQLEERIVEIFFSDQDLDDCSVLNKLTKIEFNLWEEM